MRQSIDQRSATHVKLNTENDVLWEVVGPFLVAAEKRATEDGHCISLFQVEPLNRLLVVVMCSEILQVLQQFGFPLVEVVNSEQLDRNEFCGAVKEGEGR